MSEDCLICYENIESFENKIFTKCLHGPFCNKCYNIITFKEEPKCSICRTDLEKNPLYINPLSRYVIINEITNNEQNEEINNFSDSDNNEDNYRTPPRNRRFLNNNISRVIEQETRSIYDDNYIEESLPSLPMTRSILSDRFSSLFRNILPTDYQESINIVDNHIYIPELNLPESLFFSNLEEMTDDTSSTISISSTEDI
jgi:hypothetical protein